METTTVEVNETPENTVLRLDESSVETLARIVGETVRSALREEGASEDEVDRVDESMFVEARELGMGDEMLHSREGVRRLVSLYVQGQSTSHIRGFQPRLSLEACERMIAASDYGKELFAMGKLDAQDRALATTSGSAAGIATQFMREVIFAPDNISEFESRVNVVPMPQNKMDWPKVTHSSITAAYHTENATPTPQDPTLSNVELTAATLIATHEISNEALRDYRFDAVRVFGTIFGRKFRVRKDTAYANGTGSGQPQGITNPTYTKTVDASSSLTYDDLVDATETHGSEFYNDPATVWIGNGTVRGILRKLKDSDGRPIFVTTIEGRSGDERRPLPQLMGRDYVELPALADTFLCIATLGDVGYVIGDREDFMFDSSPHQKFSSNTTVLKATASHDGRVALEEAFTEIENVG